MVYQVGFDKEKYLTIQSEKIIQRINAFDKLYLELGGKIFADMHGSRVLPGFDPDIKIDLLKKLSDKTEIVFAINTQDIIQNRIQGDKGVNYSQHLLDMIESLRAHGLYVSSVVITQYTDHPLINQLRHQLERLAIAIYQHYTIADYPTNLGLIVSEQGFGKNDEIKTTRPLVIVSAPGSGSGKMATCMSQIYHEWSHGIKAGYAKFEKFPVWNLPLHHPINLAYEAATTNIDDRNMLDPFHLEAYGESTVNYNRDIEAFPVLNTMLKEIWGSSPYKSPTDMGVNMIRECITDDTICREAAKQEIIRRYFKLICEDYVNGGVQQEIQKIEFLMRTADVTPTDRPTVPVARTKAQETGTPVVAIELPTGQIVTGKSSQLLSASASALLNALKALAKIDDKLDLISSNLITPIQNLHLNYMGKQSYLLEAYDVLNALSISTTYNPTAELVLEHLPQLKHSQAHCTQLLHDKTIQLFASLGIVTTCEA